MLENKKQFIQKLNKLASSLNITYKNVDYYFEAFSHPSFGNENKSGLNYERLEFLGDAILDFLVGEYLYKNYKDLQEGAMSKLRAEYVCEQANSKYTQEMHLDELIMLGVGAQSQGEGKRVSVLGNVFESFLGALYLDHGIDYVRDLLAIWVFPKIKDQKNLFFIDYKTKLQECMQAERGASPVYEIVRESGPAHDKTFEAIVKIDNLKLGVGIGKSKKDAEQEAAKNAIDKLAK